MVFGLSAVPGKTWITWDPIRKGGCGPCSLSCACHVLVMCLSCANLCTLNLTWNLCCPKALKDLRKNTQVTQKLLWTSVNCTFLKQRCNGTLSEALQGHVPHSGWGCRIELHRRRYQHGYPCSNQTVTDYLIDSNLHKSATLAAPWPNLLRLSGFHEIGFVKRMSKNVKEQNSVIFRRKRKMVHLGWTIACSKSAKYPNSHSEVSVIKP